MTERPPLLEIERLRVSFFGFGGERPAVAGVDLTLGSGDTLGVVGETGSGKSVLVQAIMRLVRPPGRIVSGRITFEGQDLLAQPEEVMERIRGHKIALIVPNPRSQLNPVQRVGDQIADVILAHQAVPRRMARAQVLNLMKAVGFPDPALRMESFPHELSGGMCQRIVIAMALANSPTLLLADEPTAGLDVTIQIQILDLMRDLVRDLGSTVLMVSRDLAIVAHYCNRVAVMYAGRIVEEAETQEFFDSAVHPYSLALLSSAFSARGGAIEGSGSSTSGSAVLDGQGCAFLSRCPHANETTCRSVPPELEVLRANHYVRCHRRVELAR